MKLNTTQDEHVWMTFAAAALTGLSSAVDASGEWRHGGPFETAKQAALIADALFEEFLKRSNTA